MTEEERNARERIVAAALALFADHGADAVSLRDIASRADVSQPLISHHFGSREGLRAAVDDHVTATFDHLLQMSMAELADGGATTASGFVEALVAGLPPGSPIPAYLRRMLLSGEPAGRALFRRWYAVSVDILQRLDAAGLARPTSDPPMRAAFLLANDLAMILLHDHLSDVLGADPLSPEGLQRWAADAMDAYTDGVFRKDPT